jgi:tetratricopeptide (TPR) repeat protein
VQKKSFSKANLPDVKVVKNDLKVSNEVKDSVSLSPEQQLAVVVAEAKKQGNKAVQFLSGDLFFKATDASMRGDSGLAALFYQSILSMHPHDLYIKKKLAVEYVKLNKLAEAQGLLEELRRSKGVEQEGISLTLAGIYSVQGEKEKARQVYQALLNENPKSEEACIFLAKSYAIDRMYKGAYGLLKKCEKRSPEKPIFSYYAGKVSLEQKKLAKAKKHFRHALKVDPNYYQAVIALGYLYEGEQKIDRATKVYKKFLKENPTNYPVLSRLVHLYFTQGNQSDVFPYAVTLSSLDPDDLNLKVRIGILYTEKKMYEEAKGVFKEILVAVPESDKVLYYLGSLYSETRNYSEAMDYFAKINSESPLYTDSNLQIAQILYSLAISPDSGKGNWSKKLIDFVHERASSEELRVELYGVLAGYYEHTDDVKSGIKLLLEVKDSTHFNNDHQFYLASLFEKVKNFRASTEIIETMLVKEPENAHALNFLGYSLLERGEDLDRSFALISKAVELKPNDGYIRDSLGWYYYKTGNIEKAFQEIKKAWELVRTDATISKHLAIIYREMKQFENSHALYQEALKLCKGKQEKAEILNEIRSLEDLKRLPASN